MEAKFDSEDNRVESMDAAWHRTGSAVPSVEAVEARPMR